MQSLEFLNAILPRQGLRAGWAKRNFFHETNEGLLNEILALSQKGQDAYHACASFQTAENRKQQNVAFLRSFYADIDAEKEHAPYADALAAAKAAASTIKKLGLPVPLFVTSGRGLHLYWPLEQDVPLGTWKPIADGLKQALIAAGLKIDPTRTGDASSILRTPGTLHAATGRLVQCGPMAGPFPLSLFERFRNGPANGNRPNLLEKLQSAQQESYGFADPYKIAEGCAQVRAMRDTKGNIPEPHWYNVLGVLAFCGPEGESAAHAWGTGHPNYSDRETGERLDRAKALSGPITCGKFRQDNPGACAACPHAGHITSPITLGRGHTTSVPAEHSSPAEIAIPAPPVPYAYLENGALAFQTETNKGPVNTVVSRYPIYLEGLYVGEKSGEDVSAAFKQWTPHNGWRDLTLPTRNLFSNSGVAELTAQGANIHDPKLFLNYVRLAMDEFNAASPLLERYEQFGWKDREQSFLCGATLYTPEDVRPAVVAPHLRALARGLGPRQGGSLDRWRELAGEFLGQDSEALLLTLLASLAAPLLRLRRETEGGAILSVVSRASATGKTTTLDLAQSVWGTGKTLDMIEVDSAIAKNIKIGQLSNLPILFDEMSRRDPVLVNNFVMNFTNGRDKHRGTVHGTLQQMENDWQTILISASNRSLIDILTIDESTDAPALRVFEINLAVNGSLDFTKADGIAKEMLKIHGGQAGHVFLEFITTPQGNAWARERIDYYFARLAQEIKFSDPRKFRFWLRMGAAIAVAAEAARHLDILKFAPSRIIGWMKKEMETLASGTAFIRKDASMVLGEFLNEHVRNILVVQGGNDRFTFQRQIAPIHMPTGELIVRYEVKTEKVFISEKPFRTWLNKRGYPQKEFFRELQATGCVVNQRTFRTLSAGTALPGGQVNCLEVEATHPSIAGSLPVEAGAPTGNIIPLMGGQKRG